MNYFQQESDRLIFRILTEEDIPRWTVFFENNDRIPFLGVDANKSDEALAREWITMQFGRYEKQGLGHLAAIKKDTGEFIGLGGIIPRELNGRTEYEIAYSLIPKYWRNGYGTELAQQMKKYGFENIETDRFVSIIHIDNIDSINVAKKNGMEVLFRTQFLGMTVDVYGILK